MNFFTRNQLYAFFLATSMVVGISFAGLMGNEPVSRDQIAELMNDQEFQKAMASMGIPIDKMTPTEREQLINESVQQIQQIQQMPPEEQERLMRDTFEQVRQLQEAAPTEPAKQPTQPQPTQPQEPTKPVTPAKPRIAQHTVKSSKNIVRQLAKHIERAELKFNSLLTANPDNKIELAWAQTERELPWVTSALHRITNNDKILEKIASTEYSVLKKQIESLARELKRLNKKFKVPDTAKLRHVEGIDASRADLVSDTEKEQSKKAAEAIIKLLVDGTPAITYGIKGMLEKHDKEMLEAIEKETKELAARPKKPSMAYPTPKPTPTTTPGRGRSDHYDPAYSYPSGYYDGSSPRYGYEGSSYDPTYSRQSNESKQEGRRGSSTENGKYATSDKETAKDMLDQDKTKQKDTEKEKSEELSGEFDKFVQRINELEKKSGDFNKNFGKALENIADAEALKKFEEESEKITAIKEQLLEIRANLVSITTAAHKIKQATRRSAKANAESVKEQIWQQIKNLQNTKRLADIGDKIKAELKSDTLDLLKQCTNAYQEVVKATETTNAINEEIAALKADFIRASEDTKKEALLKKIQARAWELKKKYSDEKKPAGVIDIASDSELSNYAETINSYLKKKPEEEKKFRKEAEDLKNPKITEKV